MPNTRSKIAPHLSEKKKLNRNATAEQKSSPSKNQPSTIKKPIQHSSDNESASFSNSQLTKKPSKNVSPTKNQTSAVTESSVQNSSPKQPSRNLHSTNRHNQPSLDKDTSSSKYKRQPKKKKLALPSLNKLDTSPPKNQQSLSEVQDIPTLKNKPNHDSVHEQDTPAIHKKLSLPTKRKSKQSMNTSQRNLKSPLKRKQNEHTSDNQESLSPTKKSSSPKRNVQNKDQTNVSQSTTNNISETDKDINQKTKMISKPVKFNILPTNLINIPKLRTIPSTSETTKTDKNQTASAKTIDIDKLLTPNSQTLQSLSSISQHSSKKVQRLSPLKKVNQASTTAKSKARQKRSPKKSPKKIKIPSPRKRNLQRKLNESSILQMEAKKVPNEELSDEKRRSGKRARKKDEGEQSSSTSKTEYIYIADGLKEDCQNLVEKCLQVYKLNYQKFCEIWKEMDFSCIYYGRQSGAEIAEFSEEAIHVAKAHMLAKDVNFEENVAGLFLVYAFLNLQPYKDFAALRIIPSDVPAVLHLENEARKQRRNDVLYILGSVLIKGPCQYHVLPREVAFEMPYRKYYDGSIRVSEQTVEGVLTKTSECVQQFKEAIALDQKYAAIRMKLKERNVGFECIRNLSTQPAAELFDMYREHVPGGITVDPHLEAILKKSAASQPAEEENRQDLLKSIKQRAMTNVVDAMKHLQGVDERQHDTSISSTGSETEKVSLRKSSPRSKGKGKGKGKGRSSAQILHDLFAQDVVTEELPPAPSRKEMPALSMADDLSTETPETITEPEIASSLGVIDDEPPNKPDDSVTVTLETISIPDISPSLGMDDEEPPNKRAKRNVQSKEEKTTDDSSIESSAENLVEPNSVNTTKKPTNRNDPNSDNIDSLEVLDKMQDGKDKENLDVTKTETNKSKRIEIKDAQIIKPANDSNAKVVVCEKEIDTQSHCIPVEIDTTNIEVKIIDHFNKETIKNVGKQNKTVIPIKQSHADTKADINDDNDKPITSNAVVKTSIQRNKKSKRKESRKTTDKTVETVDDSSSDNDSTKPNNSIGPSAEKNESSLGRRHLKRCRMKSTLKKMGLLEVADFEVSDISSAD